MARGSLTKYIRFGAKMSIRTVIEINHDYWQNLEDDPEAMKKLLKLIQSHAYPSQERMSGIRFLGQRHHSETLKLEVR